MTANSHVLITLISVSALGVVAIPFGNPKFTGEAIIVELSFITLSVLVRGKKDFMVVLRWH